MISATMTNAFIAATSSIAKAAVEEAIAKLSARYGFDATEASTFLLSGGIEVKKPRILEQNLPWNGKVRVGCCSAVLKNKGLFTQCPLTKKNGDLCGKCDRYFQMHGTTRFGTMEQRLACPALEYTVGKQVVVPYIVYMEKNNLTRAEVEEAAAEYGITIDPEQYVKTKRGRPNIVREMAAPVFEPPEVTEELIPPPEEVEEEEQEEQEEVEEEEITYAKVMKFTVTEARAFAEKHDIEIKKDGKIIKGTELKNIIIETLGLAPPT